MSRSTAKLAVASAAIGLCAGALIGEVAVRLLRPQPTANVLNHWVEHFYAPGDYIPFTLQPNYHGFTYTHDFPRAKVTVSTNELRTRGPMPRPREPGRKRIVVIGDSYTFGVYVADDQTFSARLQQALRSEGCDVDVINAGYSGGLGPDTQYAWLQHNIRALQPDLVVSAFFIGNDLNDIRPDQWRDTTSEGLPVRVVDSDLYIRDGALRYRSAAYHTIGTEWVYRVPVLRNSQLAVAGMRAFDRVFAHERPHHGWGGTPMPWILQSASDSAMRVKEAAYLRVLRGTQELVTSVPAEFLLLMIPINFQVEPDRFLRRVLGPGDWSVKRDYFRELAPRLDSMQVSYVDLLAEMKQRPGSYYPADGEVHFSSAGHRFTAQRVAERVRNMRICGPGATSTRGQKGRAARSGGATAAAPRSSEPRALD